MKNYLKFITVVQLFSCAADAHAQPIDMQKSLHAFVQKYGALEQFTGVPLTVQCPRYNNGQEMTFNAGFQKKHGNMMNNHSLWQIGSNSKTFTSVVMLQLEAEGKLTIEDTVESFFPGKYLKWKNITIKQLLNMTAGIPNYNIDGRSEIVEEFIQNPYRMFTIDELLDNVKNADLLFPSGTSWEYSNSNYILAGKIIETMTGHSIAEEIETRIFRPLHMNNSFYMSTFAKKSVPWYDLEYLMSGYYTVKEKIHEPYFTYGRDIIDYNMSIMKNAGAIISTSTDLNTYGRSLFLNTNLLLPEKQFKELTSWVDVTTGQPLPGVSVEHPRAYGLGLSAQYDEFFQTAFYGHAGTTFGFVSTWNYSPEKEISYVFAINTTLSDETKKPLRESISRFLFQNCY